MELEHEIMKCLMRVVSGGRRRPPHPPKQNGHRFFGYGHILDLLSQNDGLSQRQIAQALDIRPQSASEAVASMEGQGLVEKQASKEDRRISLVYITQAGKQRQIELHNERIENAKRVLEPLTDAEKETLLKLLSKAASALHENKEEC